MENLRASELRVGNYLERSVGNNTWDEFKVRPIDIYRLSEGTSWLIEHRQIPLTEEWLLKFGFVIHEDGYITCPNGRQWILHLDNEFEFEALNIIVIYVHQLQNLFFALTGKELINLE